MAKAVGKKAEKPGNNAPHRRTSIGRSANTKPTNKDQRRNYKRYRGQG